MYAGPLFQYYFFFFNLEKREYARFIHCRESHLRTVCREIHQCARIGGGGGKANLGNAKILEAPGIATPP